eukprot:Nk52_evm62s1401 gene=Nk52_evmTU62s1401
MAPRKRKTESSSAAAPSAVLTAKNVNMGNTKSSSATSRPAPASQPQKKKKKTSTKADAAKKQRHDQKQHNKRAPGGVGAGFNTEKCRKWFLTYAEVGSGDNQRMEMCPEGMCRFCEDIKVDPEDIFMLILAYRLEATTIGYFTEQRWMAGMKSLGCDCQEKLMEKKEAIREAVLADEAVFKALYKFAFDFSRVEGQKSVDVETGRAMLKVLLGKRWVMFDKFDEFLRNCSYRVINKDQWLNIFEFSVSVDCDFSQYDENSAWSVLLDEFVDFCQGNTNRVEY